VTGVFDGSNHSQRALDELQKAGLRAEQVSSKVHDKNAEGGGGLAGTTLALILGVVLGAIIGGVLGYVILDGNLPIVFGALAGASAGGAIATAAARALEARQPASARGLRQGSVLLTVQADSDKQAKEVRALFDRLGAKQLPADANR
jgi:hypothetical protein